MSALTEHARAAVHPGWLHVESLNEEGEVATQDDDLIKFSAFMQLIRTAGALDRAATEALSDLDLTAGAYGALVELSAVGTTGVAPSELARRLAVARRTATLYVDILVRHGWAAREAHPDDRRMVLARLTADGEALITRVGQQYQRRLSGLLGELSGVQAERLMHLLAQIPTDRDTTPRMHESVTQD